MRYIPDFLTGTPVVNDNYFNEKEISEMKVNLNLSSSSVKETFSVKKFNPLRDLDILISLLYLKVQPVFVPEFIISDGPD